MDARLLFPAILFLAAGAATATPPVRCEAVSQAHVVPLVELYTAEGCSDCPPADRWLSELVAAGSPATVSPLALHVDYWDEAGWPDPYSDPAYTRRQDFRLHLAKKKVRYTPHVMIGADTGVDWRDAAEVRRTLSRVRATPAKLKLRLSVERSGGALQVGVRASAQDPAGASKDLMWLAFYQNGLVSRIGEGENKGKTLRHDRVTRALLGPWGVGAQPVDGTVRIPLPGEGADLGRYGVILFAESGVSGEGLQSLDLPLANCGS